jgi:DNA-binding transcriptional MerR regulator
MGKNASNKPGHAAPAPGADNNTRLAFLEAGVSLLTVAIAGAGIELKDGQDPVEQAIAIVDSWKAKTLSLAAIAAYLAANPVDGETGDVVEDLVIARLEAAKAGPDNATEGEIAAIARADAAETRVGELEKALQEAAMGGDGEVAELQAANERIATLEAELAAARETLGGIDAAANAADAEIAQIETGPRDAIECGPTFGGLLSEALKALIDAGTTFELVFSDGAHELVEFPPTPILASDLVRHGNRFMVNSTIAIAGPRGEGAASLELDGAALLLSGEQVGYSQFERPLTVNSGDQRQFSRTFLFG